MVLWGVEVLYKNVPIDAVAYFVEGGSEGLFCGFTYREWGFYGRFADSGQGGFPEGEGGIAVSFLFDHRPRETEVFAEGFYTVFEIVHWVHLCFLGSRGL